MREFILTRPFLFSAVATWVLSAILVVTLARTRIPPSIRRQFNRMAWGLTAFVAVSFLWQVYRISQGIILPGWFYAWFYCGIFAPLKIALFFGATDREALRREYEQMNQPRR